jgi:hypothetical protein
LHARRSWARIHLRVDGNAKDLPHRVADGGGVESREGSRPLRRDATPGIKVRRGHAGE